MAVAGCVLEEPGSHEAPNPRPADAPDVVILAVSGHCNVFTSCDGDWNPEYLDLYGTVDAFARPLERRGHSVEAAAFVDDWFNWYSSDGDLLAAGFLSLVDVLEWVGESWIADYDNPTRVVVVAHSHGDVWAHIAVAVAGDVPIAALVDLDGVSVAWEDDPFGAGDSWAEVIVASSAELELEWPFEIWHAADHWSVPGRDGVHDIEDLVPLNVELNLEVYSSPSITEELAGIWDSESNMRVDGGTDGIRACASAETHGDVYLPGADCMDWAVDHVIAALEWSGPTASAGSPIDRRRLVARTCWPGGIHRGMPSREVARLVA